MTSKYSFLIIFFLFAGLSGYSQYDPEIWGQMMKIQIEENQKNIDSIYYYSGNDYSWIHNRKEFRTGNFFSDEGLSIEVYHFESSIDNWVLKEIVVGKENNLNGQLIQKTYKRTTSNDEWILDTYHKCTRDFKTLEFYRKSSQTWGGICIPGFRILNILSEQGQLSSQIYQIREPIEGNWININQFWRSYYLTGNVREEVYQNWDGTVGRWINASRSIYSDESHQGESICLRQQWDKGLSIWKNSSRLIDEYSENNHHYSSTQYLWNENEQTWSNFTQENTIYNHMDSIQMHESLKWESQTSAWVGLNRFTREYDDSGQLMEQIGYIWIDSLKNWLNIDKTYFRHNEFSKLDTMLIWNWNIEKKVWKPSSLYCYVYNSNGNLTNTFRFSWDVNNENWTLETQRIIVYLNDTLILEKIDQIWDKANQTWVNNRLWQDSYDKRDRILTEEEKYWDNNLFIWKNLVRKEIYYQSLVSSKALLLPERNFMIYPNPVSEYLYIKFYHERKFPLNIQIMDTGGRLNFNREVHSDYQINLSTYSSGVYYLIIDNCVQPFVKK